MYAGLATYGGRAHKVLSVFWQVLRHVLGLKGNKNESDSIHVISFNWRTLPSLTVMDSPSVRTSLLSLRRPQK